MSKQTPLGPKATTTKSRGLAPVVTYEPWFARCLDSIRQSLADGCPVLIRYHSGADYPIEGPLVYKNDVESHALLIIGYDDDKKALLVSDPWNKEWGGIHGGRRWIPYKIMDEHAVDSSLGVIQALSTLQLKTFPRHNEDGALVMGISAGFYSPRGYVMDRDSWLITELEVVCQLPESMGGEEVRRSHRGSWPVGEMANFTLPVTDLAHEAAELEVFVECKIEGSRPYPFEDTISLSRKVAVAESPKALANDFAALHSA